MEKWRQVAPGAELVWLLDLRSQSAALATDVTPVASLAFVVGQSVLVSIAFLRSAAAALIQILLKSQSQSGHVIRIPWLLFPFQRQLHLRLHVILK